MTEKEAREWLKSIKLYTDEKDNILEQIEQLRSIAESCTVRTDKESIQSSGSGDKMANIVGRIVDLDKKLSSIDRKVLSRRDEFEKTVQKLTNEKQKQFLTIRFYDGHSFFDTVMMMDIADSTARRIERRGISEFTKHYNTIFSGISH